MEGALGSALTEGVICAEEHSFGSSAMGATLVKGSFGSALGEGANGSALGEGAIGSAF